MKELKELKFLLKHSSIYGLGSILARIVSFALLPLYTRYLTPTDYGILELVDITTGMIGIVVGVGISSAVSRFYYESDDVKFRHQVISTVYITVATVAGISLLLLNFSTEFLAGLILDNKDYQYFFQLSFLSLFIGLIYDVGLIYLRLLHKSVIYIWLSVTSLIIAVSLNIYFVAYLEYGVLGILYSMIITRLIICIPVTAFIIKGVGITYNHELSLEMLKYSLPLIPSSIATTIVNYSDRYFIKYFISIHDAGIFALANKVGSVVHMLITSPFIMTFLPRRFEIAKEEGVKENFVKIFDYYLMLILFVTLGLSVSANEIMYFMTTPEFYRASNYVPIIALTMVILGLKYHFEFGILYTKKTKYYLYINVTTSTIHILLNYFLVQLYGVWGALYSSLAVISLNTLLIYFVAQKLYRIPFDFYKSALTLCIAVGLYYISSITMSGNIFLVMLYKFLVVMSFPLLLILFRVVSEQEFNAFKKWAKNLLRVEK